MAQLRQYHSEFVKRNAVILILGPENADAFRKYFSENNLPFIGLPDPDHNVLDLYGQQFKLFKFGRMPAQVLLDSKGFARFIHYGNDMTDIPKPGEILKLIDSLDM
jgi:peroxiredoxin